MPPPIVRGGGFPLFRRVPKNWDIGPISSLFFILATKKKRFTPLMKMPSDTYHDQSHRLEIRGGWHRSFRLCLVNTKQTLCMSAHLEVRGWQRPNQGVTAGESKWEIRGGRDRFSCKVCLEIGFLSKLPPRDKSENYEPNSNKGCPNLPEFPWFMRWNFPKFCAHGQNHISRRVVQ